MPVAPLILALLLAQGTRVPRDTARATPPAKLPACQPSRLTGFCRVGCAIDAPPRVTRRVEPDMKTVQRPYPGGIAILEIGIDQSGVPVSACVLRGVRPDFDKAAQAAALQWRWTRSVVKTGQPVGVVMTVTVAAADKK